MDKDITKLEHILNVSSKVAMITLLITIFMSFLNFKYHNRQLKIFLVFNIVRLIAISLIQTLYYILLKPNNYLLQVFKELDITNFSFVSIISHLNNFGLLGLYFSLVIVENKFINFTIRNVSILLSFCVITNYIFIEGYKNHSVFNSISSNIFCFLLPLIHLWYLYKQDSKVTISKNPYFWISFGLIIPNMLGLITSIIGKKLRETDLILYFQVDITYSILQIIGYLLIAVGFYYARYTKYMPKPTT